MGRNVKSSFSDFKISVDDAWEADDEEYNSIISKLTRNNSLKSFEDESEYRTHSQSCKVSYNQTSQFANKSTPDVGVRLIPPSSSSLTFQKDCDEIRLRKFLSLINSPVTNLSELRRLAWSGVPPTIRSTVWKLLTEYLSASQNRRQTVLLDKRRQYATFCDQFSQMRTDHRGSEMFKQIQKDISRMSLISGHKNFCDIFERVLLTCSVRRPASGYVQGFNDLLTPFFVVFLSDYTTVTISKCGELVLSAEVTLDQLNEIEADMFWCLSRLVDTIQDHYTLAQPGIQNNICMLSSLVERLDAGLHHHLASNNVEYIQFAFRWMNNLLIRELPLRCVIRLWDAYMAEPDGFSHFHVYVCVAFLMCFADQLKQQWDFQSLVLMLQSLPTEKWNEDNITMVLAEAFKLNTLFSSALKHLDYQKKDIN